MRALLATSAIALVTLLALAPGARADDFRATAPVIAARRKLPPPEILEARLPNGVRVLVVERHGIPIVSVRIASDIGVLRAPAGIACLAAASAFAGTGLLNAQQLAEAFHKLGAEHGVVANWDSTQVWVKVLTPGMDRAIELAAAIATEPSFESEGVKNVRAHELRRIEDERRYAVDALQAELRDSGDPMHERPCGTRATIESTTPAQLREHFARAFSADHMTLVVVGDTTLSEVLASANRWIGAATRAATSVASAPPESVTNAAKREIVLVDRAGSTQSTIALGAIAVARTSADRAALTVLIDAAWTKLYRVLRDQYGFTYGFQTELWALASRGEVVVEGKVETLHTGESLRQLFVELENLRSTPISDQDLALAKTEASYRDPRYDETSESTAKALAALATAGLPLDTWGREAAAVSAVTSDDVLRVARRYLDPAHTPIVTTGDAPAIRASLDDLGIPITVVNR